MRRKPGFLFYAALGPLVLGAATGCAKRDEDDPEAALEELQDTLAEDDGEPVATTPPASASDSLAPPSQVDDEPALRPTPGGESPAFDPPAKQASEDGWTNGTVNRPARLEAPPVPVLMALRTARNEGWDRLVLELGESGPGFPGYRLEYVDKPLHRCGSGEEVHPVGDAWLEVVLEPVDAHTQAGQPTVSHKDQPAPLTNVRHLYFTCDFEAQVSVVLAVTNPTPFRVFELENPKRLVVDVRHP